EFLGLYPEMNVLHHLLLSFRAMLRWRSSGRLASWIAAARSSGLPFTERYARLLAADAAAVELSIAMPWSNGPMEGQINRLKVLKRQMYGRAGFELLKARVLPLDTAAAA